MICFDFFTFKLNLVTCPKCNTEVGFIQFPMKEQVDKWEKENPGKKTGWE